MATNLIKICRLCTARTAVSQSVRSCTSKVQQYVPEDKVTHTGQKWDQDDVRMTRFVDRTKLVNDRHAIDLIAEIAPIGSDKRVVSCDGGGGPLGHPKVYINLDQPGNHSCGYCGLRFFKDGTHH